jgi:DNA modification methylase
MNPYYSDDFVTLYHGDCLEVLPAINPLDVALLLTDPPYGISYRPGDHNRPSPWSVSDQIAGDEEPFDPRPWLVYPKVVLWGANHFAHLLPPGGWIVWSKAQDNRWALQKAHTRSTGEVAWTNCGRLVSVFNVFWAGSPLYRTEERGSNIHPTQKPVSLMRWIVDRLTEPGQLVLDPFMGSGPVAAACADLGRKYIGIEVEERYCEVAASRFAQGSLDFGGAA